MGGSLVADLGVGPEVWLFLTLLGCLTIFFKFSRFWSIRNLDLLLLFALAPGMMMLVGNAGSQPWTAYLFLFLGTFLWLGRCLVDLGLTSIRILTNNPKKIHALEGYGLSVTAQIPIEETPNPEFWGFKTYGDIKTHPQEILENGADWLHFNTVHATRRLTGDVDPRSAGPHNLDHAVHFAVGGEDNHRQGRSGFL